MRIASTFILLLSTTFFIACGDTDNGDNGGSANANTNDEISLGVRIVNTGSGDVDVEESHDFGTVYCYADTGDCEVPSGFSGSFSSVFEGQSMVVSNSEIDREAIGVLVNFEVTEGSGIAEIVTGRTYESGGFEEFSVGEVVHTSAEFSAGDTVSFEFGDTN